MPRSDLNTNELKSNGQINGTEGLDGLNTPSPPSPSSNKNSFYFITAKRKLIKIMGHESNVPSLTKATTTISST
jgi:hypothetical protein